jgi:HNH endonuclease
MTELDMSPETLLCPYCSVRVRDSDDHVFPAFLGGKKTIRACKPCNDLFGHEFEGPVSNDLAPTVITLRRAGLRPPRRVVWKRALEIEGKDFDLDSNLALTPTTSSVERDSQGQIKGALFSNRRAAENFVRSQEGRGKKVKSSFQKFKPVDLKKLTFKLNIGSEMRRLAIKIAVAATDLMGIKNELLDEESQSFLLGDLESTQRVRIDFAIHSSLEKLRPPLSHCIFVKGNSQTRKSYAIVQFYGLVQLYVLLNDGRFTNPDFAILGVIDVAKGYAERFEKTELLMLPEAPTESGYWKSQELMINWVKKFNSETKGMLQYDTKLSSLQIP